MLLSRPRLQTFADLHTRVLALDRSSALGLLITCVTPATFGGGYLPRRHNRTREASCFSFGPAIESTFLFLFGIYKTKRYIESTLVPHPAGINDILQSNAKTGH